MKLSIVAALKIAAVSKTYRECMLQPRYRKTDLIQIAILYSAPKEKVWDMAMQQFVSLYCGVRTNHSTVFSHMIPEVCG